MIRYNKQSITNNDMNTLIELWRLDNVLDDYGNNQSSEVRLWTYMHLLGMLTSIGR